METLIYCDMQTYEMICVPFSMKPSKLCLSMGIQCMMVNMVSGSFVVLFMVHLDYLDMQMLP